MLQDLELETGWLLDTIDTASNEVDSWSDEMKNMLVIIENETLPA